MSQDQLKSFLKALLADPTLHSKFLAAGDNLDEIIEIAQAAGFVISPEDLTQSPESMSKLIASELSEEELEDVAGGGNTCWPWKKTDCIIAASL